MSVSSSILIYAADIVVPQVDMSQKATLAITLEDESRFMGVDIYQVGEHDGTEFKFFPQYRDLVDKDYYALDSERQKSESCQLIEKYIKKNADIKADYSVNIVNGEAKLQELPLGVFIVVQNEGDHNAQLRKTLIVEAPLLDEEQNIYLYDIELYPKWDRTVWFSFRPEVVFPLVIVLLLIICVLLCIFSTRMVNALMGLTVFLLAGLGGMKLGMVVTGEFIWLLVFFVVFAFLGLGIVGAVFGMVNRPIKKLGLNKVIQRQLVWIIPIFAGIAGGYIVYSFVSTKWWFFAAIPGAVVVVGEIIQYLRRDKEVIFYTYDDLLKLSILQKEDEKQTVTEGE